MRSRWRVVALSVLLIAAAVFAACMMPPATGTDGPAPDEVAQSAGGQRSASRYRSDHQLADIPVNGERAYDYLKALCALGSRMSGSEGMDRQQKLLAEHFERLGGKVEFQRFQIRHPVDGSQVILANLIVRWHPERKERVLLCAHYDTRPFPDQDPDPRKRRDLFVGANDGASGTALLMELAHEMPKLDSRYGVDFVLFDGEEFVFSEWRDKDFYFIGSTWFARDYATNPPGHRYRWGVLLDMVGDADLQIFQERNSLKYTETRRLVHAIWNVARDLKVREFIAEPRHTINDDHIPLNEIAKIPTCDLIDFDYPHWHTTADTPERCSALSLAKVGWVVLEWLRRLE
jgi:glutaminyl-peptide cyclotransferase